MLELLAQPTSPVRLAMKYWPLSEVTQALAQGQPRRALEMLQRIDADPLGSPTQRLAVPFVHALRGRALGHPADPGNLYAGQGGPEAMLSAFRLLVNETPLIRFGHTCANVAIDQATMNEQAVHLIDIGMGHGMQWFDLLERFGERSRRPAVRLTGVDLPAPGADPAAALNAAGAKLAEFARAQGVPFQFEARVGTVESVDEWNTHQGEALAINAAFALHHVPDENRDTVLTRLRGLRPRVLTLVEPDAAHNPLPFPERVAEAWRHYGLVFSIFEHLFPRDLDTRRILEGAFFGREILNMVGAEGADRVERHDRILAWRKRMHANKFTSIDISNWKQAFELATPFTARRDGETLALRFNGQPVLGVSAWSAER